MAPSSELVPARMRPSSSMSTPVAGSVVDSGAYIVQPTGAPPKAKALTIMMPPATRSQNDSALMRGKAISAAPIWSGTT